MIKRSSTTKRRHLLQYRLRTLLALVLVVSALLKVIVPKWQEAEREGRAVRALRDLGGGVYSTLEDGDFSFVAQLLVQLGGEGFFQNFDSVYFNDQPITDDDLAHLEALVSLDCVSLCGTAIGNEGLEHIAGLQTLEFLFLDNTAIDGDGFRHLRELRNLRWLSLSETHVGDRGLESLGSLVRLERLNLCNTDVTDVGVRKLEYLVNLRQLFLCDTNVTAAGLEHLEGALPETDIYPSSIGRRLANAMNTDRRSDLRCQDNEGGPKSYRSTGHARSMECVLPPPQLPPPDG